MIKPIKQSTFLLAKHIFIKSVSMLVALPATPGFAEAGEAQVQAHPGYTVRLLQNTRVCKYEYK